MTSRHRSKKSRPERVRWIPHAPVYTPPGTISVDPEAPKPAIRVIAFGPDAFIDEPISDVRLITNYLHRYPVTWVNVDGLGDAETIRAIGEIFGIHRLALEDVAHVRQRAKVDEYPEHLYIVARMIDRSGERLNTEQLSMFLGKDYVLTFQEYPGDCLDAIRLRLKERRGRVREAAADYLAYAILDAVIDEYFPILEIQGDRLEELEDRVLADPDPALAARVHQIKRELVVLRRGIWPLREAIAAMLRGSSSLFSTETRLYLRDCHDHTFQVLDLVEVYRELSAGLIEMYMTSVGYRMNQIMKVLTIIATIFIPLTFIVGLYGMNFEHMPELHWRWGYPLVLLIMAAVAGVMLVYFWRKGWMKSTDSTVRAKSDSD